jgi:ribosomal protein S8
MRVVLVLEAPASLEPWQARALECRALGPAMWLLRRRQARLRKVYWQQPSPTARAIAASRTTCIATNPYVRQRNGRSILASLAHLSPSPRSPSRANTTHTGNMSLVNLAHVCSHLQNASKARLGLTSIPVSKMHVKLVLGLQREGFLSSVTLGGVSPPKPFLLQTQPDPEELDHMAQKFKEEPWQAFNVGSDKRTEEALGQEKIEHVSVPQNPARRRLWLGLKYWNNEPVLKNMKLISKPTRRIWLTSQDLGKITRTRESSYVKGLTHPGECMFLTTDRGILEARECVERQLGGMALCRVW